MLKNVFRNKKNKDLKYDFLPSDLEIIERPASPLGHIIIYIVTIFLFLVLLIACIAKIDITVVSQGNVLPIDGIKTVDSNINGKIIEIFKGEGDEVKTGDEILKIENSNSEEKQKEIENNIEIDKLKMDLLGFKIDGNFDESVYDNYNIDEDKKNELKLEDEVEKNNVEKDEKAYNKSIDSINNNKNKLEEEIKKIEEQYNSMDDKSQEGQGNVLLENIKDKKSQIQELNDKKQSLEDNFNLGKKQKQLKYVQDKNNLDVEVNTLENNLVNIKNQIDNYIIKAPIDGVILQSNYNTVNSYINQSKPIVEIVPSNTEYEIEAYIPTKDISRIKLGQAVVIKVDSYDYQKYGTINGEVSYISPNSFNNENKGIVYKIKIKFAKDENSNINIMPGMGATVEIKSDKIRLIEYFLEPFKKNFDNALKG